MLIESLLPIIANSRCITCHWRLYRVLSSTFKSVFKNADAGFAVSLLAQSSCPVYLVASYICSHSSLWEPAPPASGTLQRAETPLLPFPGQQAPALTLLRSYRRGPGWPLSPRGEWSWLSVVWSQPRGSCSETTEETIFCFPLRNSADSLPSWIHDIVLSLTNRLNNKICLAQIWESGMRYVLSEIFQLFPEAKGKF